MSIDEIFFLKKALKVKEITIKKQEPKLIEKKTEGQIQFFAKG